MQNTAKELVVKSSFTVAPYPCDTTLYVFGDFNMTEKLEQALLERGFGQMSKVNWKWNTFMFWPETEKHYARFELFLGQCGVGSRERAIKEDVISLIEKHG